MIKDEENEVKLEIMKLLPDRVEWDDLSEHLSLAHLYLNWHALSALGFELSLSPNALWVQHNGSGFCTAIQLSEQDDMGERRALYIKLRSRLGTFCDKIFGAIFLPSDKVMGPYKCLGAVIAVCQEIREMGRKMEVQRRELA